MRIFKRISVMNLGKSIFLNHMSSTLLRLCRCFMIINLQSSFFEKKCELITHGKFKITAFKYPSGVEALLVEGERLSFVFTPLKGQQIWHLKVDGKEISMKTSVEYPKNTSVYLQNYGGFLYHCGIISFFSTTNGC